MLGTVLSRNQIPIRLMKERWNHIAEEHGELVEMQDVILRTVSEAERILLGSDGEHLAVREIELGKWMVVVYREFEDDGFIITAFMTRKEGQLDRRVQLWP